jgi:hypothetical protein
MSTKEKSVGVQKRKEVTMPNQSLQQTAAAILVPRDSSVQHAAAAAEPGRSTAEVEGA